MAWWIDQGEIEYTRSSKRRRASYEEIICWVAEAWKSISDDSILKGFRECRYIEWDGDFASLHSKFRDTLLKREVPLEVILEMDRLLLELQEENNEVSNEIEAANFNDDGEMPEEDKEPIIESEVEVDIEEL